MAEKTRTLFAKTMHVARIRTTKFPCGVLIADRGLKTQQALGMSVSQMRHLARMLDQEADWIEAEFDKGNK